MVKRVKKIKVKKPRQPRQKRAVVPRKPPVTNVTVNITGGTNQPSGSYFFPDANQSVQPLAFTPVQPPPVPAPVIPPTPVYRPLEEPALQPLETQDPSRSARGRPRSDLTVGNKKLPELQKVAEALGMLGYENLNRSKLAKAIKATKTKMGI